MFEGKENVYKMGSNPRGRAIIINMEERREGSEMDVEGLEQLFKGLHFDVDIWNDDTKQVILLSSE